jgi:hypothetical protein
VKHGGYKNYLTIKSSPNRLFVMKIGFEDKNEDWVDTPPHGADYEGQGSYSSWQRLTKRKFPMSQPTLEGNKFERIMKRSFFNRFNLPKRQDANNGEEYSAWRRLTKRQVMSQSEVGKEQFQNIQRKSVHNNWLKLGYVEPCLVNN